MRIQRVIDPGSVDGLQARQGVEEGGVEEGMAGGSAAEPP